MSYSVVFKSSVEVIKINVFSFSFIFVSSLFLYSFLLHLLSRDHELDHGLSFLVINFAKLIHTEWERKETINENFSIISFMIQRGVEDTSLPFQFVLVFCFKLYS